MYVIYAIRNLLTNELYIGQHRTDNPDDDYMGSGIGIKLQRYDYSPNTFKKIILFSGIELEKEALVIETIAINAAVQTLGKDRILNRKQLKPLKQTREINALVPKKKRENLFNKFSYDIAVFSFTKYE